MSFSGFVTLLLHPISLVLMGFFLLRLAGRGWQPKYMRCCWISLRAMLYLVSTNWLLRPLVLELEDDYSICNVPQVDITAPIYFMVLGKWYRFWCSVVGHLVIELRQSGPPGGGHTSCPLAAAGYSCFIGCLKTRLRPGIFLNLGLVILLGIWVNSFLNGVIRMFK